jgi:transcriptional regulator with XRE-family HTH domain
MDSDRDKSIDIYVGMKLRQLRKKLNISQEQLAEVTNVTFQQVQKYEKGVNRISCSTLYAFSRFLGVDIRYFFDDIDCIPQIKDKPQPPASYLYEESPPSIAFDSGQAEYGNIGNSSKTKFQPLIRAFNLLDEQEQIEALKILKKIIAINKYSK